MYTAAVLTPNSSGLLRWAAKAVGLEEKGFGFSQGLEDKIHYPHHMTINLGGIDEELNARETLDQPARLYVKKFGWCDRLGVCAALVFEAEVEMQEWPAKYWETLYSFNVHPHITMCTRPHVPPKLSNDMLASDNINWVDLDQTYMLDAVVKEVSA